MSATAICLRIQKLEKNALLIQLEKAVERLDESEKVAPELKELLLGQGHLMKHGALPSSLRTEALSEDDGGEK